MVRERERVHVCRGFNAGAECFEALGAQFAKQRFGHDAARRIGATQEQHIALPAH
jgi:hypothetical protein